MEADKMRKIKELLKQFNITTEKELDAALTASIAAMPLGIMTDPPEAHANIAS